ncbi:MAG: radical SAM protein [Fusobacteriaceae bacterium]
MPQLVDLKVGFSCNNFCVHCVICDKNSEKDLTTIEIKTLISEYIKKYNKIKLTLTGGEVTMRKDFFEILDFIDSKKSSNEIVFVDMQTNGRYLSDLDFAKRTLNTVDFFLIALHGPNNIIHDSITCSRGSFIETTNGIKNIISLGGKEKIAIQTVINKINISKLSEIYKFINKDLEIKECNITFPHPVGKNINSNIIPSYIESQEQINLSLSYCLDNEIYPYIEAIPFCIFWKGKNRDYAISFFNDRTITTVGYAGKLDGHIDYQAVFDGGHTKYESCNNCNFSNICEGIWNEHKIIYPNENIFNLSLKNGENHEN